jgi:hypothetical protein
MNKKEDQKVTSHKTEHSVTERQIFDQNIIEFFQSVIFVKSISIVLNFLNSSRCTNLIEYLMRGRVMMRHGRSARPEMMRAPRLPEEDVLTLVALEVRSHVLDDVVDPSLLLSPSVFPAATYSSASHIGHTCSTTTNKTKN